MPRRRAARKMVSPARMSISRSSIVKVWPEELAEESSPWSPGCGLLLSLIMQTLDYQCPSGLVSSSGKYFNTHNKGRELKLGWQLNSAPVPNYCQSDVLNSSYRN